MSSYEQAIAKTELWEGGYSNNPSDSGGETYRGISRNNWPNWSGWVVIDEDKSQPFFPATLDGNSSLQAAVVDFYRQNFWNGYGGINNQDVANKIFDLSVNVGTRHAVSIAQIAAGCSVDGKYGPNTQAAINSHLNGSLLPKIEAAAEQYYRAIVASNPQDARFLKDWIRRASSNS